MPCVIPLWPGGTGKVLKLTYVVLLALHVQVLEAAGKEAVLQEARKALQQLTGSSS